MSAGHSLHKKDYLMMLGGLGLAATGLGAAGMGPLAGMLGGEAAAGAGAAGAAGAGAGIGEGASSALLQGLGSMGPEQAGMLASQNAGFGADGLGMTLKAASTAQPGVQGMLSNSAGGLLTAGTKAAGGPMAAQVGMGLLNPQQQQRPPMMAQRPMGGGEQAPMPLPYGGSSNSMDGPPPGMSMQEWLRRKQMMGGMR
jgi:hypothetical protein